MTGAGASGLDQLESDVKGALEVLRQSRSDCERLRRERDELRTQLGDVRKRTRGQRSSERAIRRLEQEVERLRRDRETARTRVRELIVKLKA
jgi:predicted RNase H-like nuclease (RuvC/YqgF family)